MVDYYFDLTGTRAVLIPRTHKKRRRTVNDTVHRHDWFAYPAQRKLLFFMDRYYQNDRDDLTRIFNFAFSDELPSGGLAKRTLDAQIRDDGTKRVPDVAEILDLPDKEVLPKIYSDIHGVIVKAAKSLHITLISKTATGRVVPTKTSMKRKKRAFTDSSDSDSSIDMSIHSTDSESEILSKATKRTASSFHATPALASLPRPSPLTSCTGPLTPLKSGMTVSPVRRSNLVSIARRNRHVLLAVALTPPVTPSKNFLQSTSPPNVPRRKSLPKMPEILSHDGVPFLLFRCWDENSYGTNSTTGFAGGLNLDVSPMLETDTDFLLHAEAHLRNRPQPSPLISLTTSLPTALRKAAHKVAAGGSPIIAVLDGRAIAMQTRLYHARVVISELRENSVSLPYYGSNGKYEYLAWQKADAIVGQVSLAQLRDWTQYDVCLGALLIQNDLGKMGVPAFRRACRNALAVGSDLGRSLGSLARLFRPTTSQHDPFLKDFVNFILQGFNLAELPGDWETNIDFIRGLFALPAPIIAQPMSQDASVPRSSKQHVYDDFEDIDDVLREVGDTPETGNAPPANNGFEIITIDDDDGDDDNDLDEHATTMGQGSGYIKESSNCTSRPEAQTRLREQTPLTPLAHRTRASSIASDEATISLPPSPFDTMRAQMRIAALQASPTPGPCVLPSEMEDFEESTVPGSAARMPVPWIDREAAMQQMVSVVPFAERERWTLAFDMYVRGLVMEIMNEAGSI